MANFFVHFNTKAGFTAATKGTEYTDNSIVFIKDTQEIWTHGLFYAIPDAWKTRITALESKVTALETSDKTHATTEALNQVKNELTALITAISDDYLKAADIADMATQTWVNTQLVNKVDAAELDKYILKTQPAVAAVANDATKKTLTVGNLSQEVLVAHQDISGKANVGTVTALEGRVSNLETAVGEGVDAQIEAALDELKGESDYDTFDDIQEAVEAVDARIDGLDLTAVGGTNKLITTISQTDGKVAATAIEVGDGLEVASNKLKVKLAQANKILSFSEGLLATVTLDYATKGTLAGNTDKEVIQLKGVGGTVISEISAEPFLMDRFLKNVELDGSELTFTFEVKHGTDADIQDLQ